MNNVFRKIWHKINYQIELVSQLITVISIGIVYGIIESNWIPTDTMNAATIPILGNHWSYYHLFLLAIVFIASFSLALSHIHWIISNRKKYILFMCLALLPLGLMIEDATWFVARWRPIENNEWTMLSPGLGVNIGFTWIPLWYILVWIFSLVFLWISDYYADKGFKKYLAGKSTK